MIIIVGTVLYLGYAAVVGGADVMKKIKAVKGELTVSFLIVLLTFMTSMMYMEAAGSQNVVAAAIMGVVVGNMLDNFLNSFYGIS